MYIKEYLIADEGDNFALAGSVEDELLAITAVHPMRREAVDTLLGNAGADWGGVRKLEPEGKLKPVAYAGRDFYVRRFPGTTNR